VTAKSKSKAPEKSAKRKVPRKMTRQRLKNIAVFHLQRYSTTAANLKRVLMRRIDKSLREHEGDRREMAGWADEVVAGLVAAGALNDARYAEGRAAVLRGMGRSAAKVRARLAAKGVSHKDITKALADTARTADGEDADLVAARDYAARRRLGAWRQEQTPDTRKKDMATLGRAGFSYAVAKTVMDEEA